MNITEPKVGALYSLDNQIYEIVSINDSLVSMCSLVHQYRRFIDFVDFASMEQRGKLLLHQRAATDLSPGAQLAALSAEQRARVEYKLAYVDANLRQMGGQTPKAATKKLIAQVAKKIGDVKPPCVSSLWNWKARYLASNRSPFSLLKKVPPPRKKRMPETIEDLVRHYIKTVYMTRECPTLRHTHRLLAGHVAAENRERHQYGAAHMTAPSYATFRRRVQNMDKFRMIRERHGLKEAQRRCKSSGHLFIDDDPYACTLFDSKHMDVFVKGMSGEILGRPILSVQLNPASREIPGWDISIGAPCAEKMMSATIRAIVRHGKVGIIYSDHGPEIFNNWTLSAFNFLGITVDYVPVGDPDAKAPIERFFNTVDVGFCHNLPGTTKGSPAKRGDYPSEQRACLTLENLRSAFAIWIDAYHNTWQDEVFTSPTKKGEALRLSAPPPEQFTEEELKQLCLSRWLLSLDRGRVKKSHLIWHGPGLAEVSQRLGPKQKAIVYFNPCDLGTVWVAHPDTPNEWHPAIGTLEDYQKGLSWTDHTEVRKAFIAERRGFDHTEACIKLYELNELIEEYKKIGKKNKKNKPARTQPKGLPNSRIEKKDSSNTVPLPAVDPSNFDTYKIKGENSNESPE